MTGVVFKLGWKEKPCGQCTSGKKRRWQGKRSVDEGGLKLASRGVMKLSEELGSQDKNTQRRVVNVKTQILVKNSVGKNGILRVSRRRRMWNRNANVWRVWEAEIDVWGMSQTQLRRRRLTLGWCNRLDHGI